MNTISCKGLDGSNPLHVLAALGLLRLAERIAPGAKMGWVLEKGTWNPFLETTLSQEALTTDATAWLNALGKTQHADPMLNRRVRELGTKLKKANEAQKEARKKIREEAKENSLKSKDAGCFISDKLASGETLITELELELVAAREELAASNGSGIAHFGDVIAVSPGIVRRAGEEAITKWFSGKGSANPSTDDSGLMVGHLAALACGQVVMGGKVAPTRYSFGNGAGGQCLLKDFRNLASSMTQAHLKATLAGDHVGRFCEGVTNLNWDPAANRSYAMNWENPEKAEKSTDIAANALAYIGLGLLTVMPSDNWLVAVGWGPGDEWTWPIWGQPLSLNVVRSLLAHDGLMRESPDLPALHACGIMEVRRSERIDPTGQGRPYFSPSRPV